MLIGSRQPEVDPVEELHHPSAHASAVIRRAASPLRHPRSSSLRMGSSLPRRRQYPPGASLPQRVLALDALRLMRDLRDPARRPDRWGDPAFARRTDLIRRHLAPLRSRRTLAASFGREAFQVAIEPGDPVSPIRIAYAIRWLELGDGTDRPGWSEMLESPSRR